MQRRRFLGASLSAAVAAGAGASLPLARRFRVGQVDADSPIRSIIPVVGDGKWIWREPPTDQTGYLEPRRFDVSIGVQLASTGSSSNLMATTAVPVNLPEQKVEDLRIDTQGCVAQVRQLTPQAGQLVLAAPGMVADQVVRAVAHFRLTLFKIYQAYQRDQFPEAQQYPREFRKAYLFDSPGIQTRGRAVRDLAVRISESSSHPWDKAKAFYGWVWENIQGRIQSYTSVTEALRQRVGDCEERAAVFVAFCRACGIPARLVWVPNHNWAEFYLTDASGQGHWIPAHTAAYSWFGWTGVHELVLQKGDNIRVPEKRQTQRLLADWMQWQGAKPKVRYTAELAPVADTTGSDPGPGARSKDEKGEWIRVGNHPLDNYTRQ